jgi:hypothetical protein
MRFFEGRAATGYFCLAKGFLLQHWCRRSSFPFWEIHGKKNTWVTKKIPRLLSWSAYPTRQKCSVMYDAHLEDKYVMSGRANLPIFNVGSSSWRKQKLRDPINTFHDNITYGWRHGASFI